MTDAHTLVIAVGNPLRGDDAVGQEVANLLWSRRERSAVVAGATFVFVQQLTPELALDLSSASFALFLDATCDGQAPGTVTVVHLAPATPTAMGIGDPGSGCWQDISPQGLLALASRLYGWAAPAVLVSVSAGSFGLGAEMSAAVQAAVPMAATAARLALGACHRAAPEPVSVGGRGGQRRSCTS